MSRFEKQLDALQQKNRYRFLNLPRGIDLTSNDYLGFKDHPALKDAAAEAIESGIALGSGGSRLLRGHSEAHESLEAHAATFFGTEAALFFPTGYQANNAIFGCLPSRHDTIIFDEYIHASAREGIQNAPARKIKVPHNDLNAFESALKKARPDSDMVWIAIESLYSMDGDFAPLAALIELAGQYGAMLIVDEAHATGVFGKQGEGLVLSSLRANEESAAIQNPEKRDWIASSASPPRNDGLPDHIITLHTCGKALGLSGGLVCAAQGIIDTMINTARPFIYSTAPAPFQAHMVQKSLELCASNTGTEQRNTLHTILNHVKLNSFIDPKAQSQIIPIILGSDARAVEVASALQREGYDIRAIRAPSVPEGTARLRLSLHAGLTTDTLESFQDILNRAKDERNAA